MNKYRCDHSPGSERTDDQALDLICRGCLRAWMARHNSMLNFVKAVMDIENGTRTGYEAELLLEEIGEL